MLLCPTSCRFPSREGAEAFLRQLEPDPCLLPAGPITFDDPFYTVRYYGAAELRDALERARWKLLNS